MKNTKICFYCQKELPYSQFHKMSKNKDGYQSRCKKCIKKPKLTSFQRFLRMVDKNTKSGCWEWIGSKDKNGYGKFSVHKMNIRAHRYSWEFYNKKTADDMLVCHHCDNSSCVNPDHLFIGDNSDNFQDMLRKGRGNKASGENSGTSKLKKSDVLKIRKMHNTGKYTYGQISDNYNVSAANIGCIVRGETWKQI